MASGRPPRRRTDALDRFRDYLDEIDRAIVRRDSATITALLRKRIATHLPRDVREELLAHARAPRTSLRAPVQFLRFQHRMTELARGGERLLEAQTELAFERPPDSGAARRDGERQAARDASPDGRP